MDVRQKILADIERGLSYKELMRKYSNVPRGVVANIQDKWREDYFERQSRGETRMRLSPSNNSPEKGKLRYKKYNEERLAGEEQRRREIEQKHEAASLKAKEKEQRSKERAFKRQIERMAAQEKKALTEEKRKEKELERKKQYIEARNHATRFRKASSLFSCFPDYVKFDQNLFDISIVYFLISDEEIVYIGETDKGIIRMGGSYHVQKQKKIRKITEVRFLHVPTKYRKLIESYFIRLLKPVLNVSEVLEDVQEEHKQAMLKVFNHLYEELLTILF